MATAPTAKQDKPWTAIIHITKPTLERFNHFIMGEVQPAPECKNNLLLMAFAGRFDNGYTAILGMIPAGSNVSGAIGLVFRPDGDALPDGTFDLSDYEGLDDVHPNIFTFEADGHAFELHVITVGAHAHA
jgi:hypothetical protein